MAAERMGRSTDAGVSRFEVGCTAEIGPTPLHAPCVT